MSEDLVLAMRGITKEFPGVKALDNVNFELKKGEIHAICGENGAGKSTLLKILNGIYQTYDGYIEINNSKVKFNSPKDAKLKGLSIISQDVQLAPELSVAENVFMGQYPRTSLRFVDWRELIRKTKDLQEMLGNQALKIDPKEKVRNLSPGQRQIVEILKSISFNVGILALDEPTSSLSNEETVELFKLLRELSSRGVSIIYVSHRLKEIFDICNRVTVLKDGKYVGTEEISKISTNDVINMMVGRNVKLFAEQEYHDKTDQQVALEVADYSRKGVFENISLKVHKGEIIGLFGIVGSGRTEVVRAIFGLDKKTSGTLSVNGKTIDIRSPQDAIKYRIGFVPEDRRKQGLVSIASIRWNMSIPYIRSLLIKRGFIQFGLESQMSNKQMESLKIKAPSDLSMVGKLSGGNQQKVVLGRWLGANSDILICDEPTRGIDVGSKAEIYKLLRNLAAEGKSIILISSELPEIMGLSDRIYVFRDGKIAGEIKNSSSVTDVELLEYAVMH